MAPRKGHRPKGGSSQKATIPVPDSDHIVFSNSKKADTQNDAGKDKRPISPRPDARKVIGGASWTGKLPVNLLAEHCQKQKWNKPEYSMRKAPADAGDGHISHVTLSSTNPKTKEIKKLAPFQLPPCHRALGVQETPLEARHFAATYALFRVASMKSIHMTLPPKYRDLWKGEFAKQKEEDVKAGRAWMYDADPFAAATQTQKIHDAIKLRSTQANGQKMSGQLSLHSGPAMGKGYSKAWQKAPKVEMGTRIRSVVEGLVKEHSIWNRYGLQLTDTERNAILKDLASLGFRRSHVEEAVRQCQDREEVLHWLLIYVPEDDLPSWTFPENYTSGISLASGDLAKEAKLKSLSRAGYSSDDCALALERSHGDERAAAEELQSRLIGLNPTQSNIAITDDRAAWKEELDTLGATFGDRFSSKISDGCAIAEDTGTPFTFFHFQRPRGNYPQNCLPILAVHSDKLPAYIRLSIVRGCLLYATESLLGGPMIFNMVEWIEANLSSIVDDPGPLREISMRKTDTGNPLSRSSVTERPRIPVRLLHKKKEDHAAVKARKDSRSSLSEQQKMMLGREALPAWGMRDRIIEAIESHQCVIVSGETGSGKSTQCVQFVLDHMIETLDGGSANIVCTQPRRISALGLADRVSSERCSAVGEEVGYTIRGDSRLSAQTKITFMTTGVLLRRMQSYKNSVEALDDISHLFIDEVHERSVDTDFLLALLRDAMIYRPELKIVLMSATLDADVFVSYFGGSDKVGQVHIPGRTYPVSDYSLDDIVAMMNADASQGLEEEEGENERFSSAEVSLGRSIQSLGIGTNYNLIAQLVARIDEDLGNERGGILIFLAGTLEIDRCLSALRNCRNIHALPLHASLTPLEQRKVFSPAPKGMRKVVASTNVAETSITIADIVAVIDTGRVKETRYDVSNSIVRLEEVWASRAACKQRRGRAGRVQAGKYYKLFTRKVESGMAAAPQPEIQRLPLEQLCLSVKATSSNRDVAQFLQQTLTPPKDEAVSAAMKLLHRVGALDKQELTALGRHLAMIPADLRCGKLLVYGSIFGCLEACLTVVAILTVKDPFVSPREKREEAKAARSCFSAEHGDLIQALAAFTAWREQAATSSAGMLRDWCSERFLSLQTLRDISSTRSQLLASLVDAGIVPMGYPGPSSLSASFNRDGDNAALLRALIASALNPQIARIEFPDKKYAASMAGAVEVDFEARTIKYFNEENGRVFVHPSSSLFDAQSFSGSASYVSYFTKVATSKTFIRDLTPFNAYGLLLFSGPIAIDTDGHGLVVDGWLRMRGWPRIGVLVSRLRALLDETLLRRIDRPCSGEPDAVEEQLVSVVRRLVQFNGQDR